MYKLFRYKALYRDRCLLKIRNKIKLVILSPTPSILETTFGDKTFAFSEYLFLKNLKHAYIIYMGIK